MSPMTGNSSSQTSYMLAINKTVHMFAINNTVHRLAINKIGLHLSRSCES